MSRACSWCRVSTRSACPFPVQNSSYSTTGEIIIIITIIIPFFIVIIFELLYDRYDTNRDMTVHYVLFASEMDDYEQFSQRQAGWNQVAVTAITPATTPPTAIAKIN
ncbi:hypothetical protein T492DRAFT_841070 [Pavlovales sp. CCMP2436]|nr:hypothetical protein T492DRAFT_841070 [Pavlovales sp. CCMP2436]